MAAGHNNGLTRFRAGSKGWVRPEIRFLFCAHVNSLWYVEHLTGTADENWANPDPTVPLANGCLAASAADSTILASRNFPHFNIWC